MQCPHSRIIVNKNKNKMVQCPQCSSHKVQSRGVETNSSGESRRRFRCTPCGKWFSQVEKSKFDPILETNLGNHKKFVITGVQNNSSINWDFYKALQQYCELHDAKLIVVPMKYRLPHDKQEVADRYELPEDDLFRRTVRLSPKLRLLGDINITPTIENPLSGLDYLSKGDSLIIVHPQLQMKTLAVNSVDTPAVITTTGVISSPRYSLTKQGTKALFNHSFSALIVELDPVSGFHLRVLNGDDNNGFYDIDGYYNKTGRVAPPSVEALVTGDEHALFIDQSVLAATYTNADSIVNTLKPRRIVRHDVLDFFSGSHHHAKSFLTKYAKYEMGTNIIEDELTLTLKHIADTTPSFSENVLVASNHVEHLHQWLDTVDPKTEVWNSKLYHRLMYLMLESMTPDGKSFIYPSAFKLWVENTKHKFSLPKMVFLERNMSYKICDIELSNHGDQGTNGSRGSAMQFSKLSHKMIVGHSHSPSITKGAYTVGTSTGKLEYTRGPSSWANFHCVIYSNGKRQMIGIFNGKWHG